MHRLAIVVAMLAVFAAAPARAAEPWRMLGLVLLQPEAVLRERVPGGAQAMHDYIQSVDTAATNALAGVDPPRPTSGFLVLAVRAGGQSKAWLDLWPNLPRASEPALIDAVQAVKPFDVREGTVVFALRVSAWGAAPTNRPPKPDEWTRYTREGITDAETIVGRLWPGGSRPDGPHVR